ncbi:phosphoenolpyruvate hydrolase family protein [Maledivibacter halophilus]|uniref:Response regulator containing CheY-like receiver, AAA-type ATPase, and DNA-binding domains n=1 Tax=Maledivibacter halophilus TaxID=36842 RepID=A0A1T5LES4_9FIRM|nr:phosphoenolpyruvate hydrolase family protein [Maledivibacter halophilus]SKC73888.1 Response regulator containing CheY-like receiver, AAA-type ATPase, and DNA-binding domains [Maledivibacter halophilus]
MINRKIIKNSLSASIKKNKPIIGVAVGSGLAAKQADEGGADLILALSAGRFRNAGVASLGCMMPFANSNNMVMDFGKREILQRVRNKPVIFGACGTDLTWNQDELLNKIIEAGFHGVTNFPTIGIIDGVFREALEEIGLGYNCEIELMEKAVKKGMFTIAFVFDKKQAVKMVNANVDIICTQLGWTIGGDKGVKQRKSISEYVKYVEEIVQTVKKLNPQILNMVYGGPINDPEQANLFYKKAGALGYIGGSSFERIPTEISIKNTTAKFKNFYKIKEENIRLKQELIKKKGFDEIVGQSKRMQEIYDIVNKVADKDVNVLVEGESGTGKELIVRAIHYNSKRYREAFVKINCAAFPKGILESELFGHEKGAFTGADKRRLGKFELADKGTLFLDEIGEMDLDVQAKLLRIIQQQEFQRVGGNKTIKIDVRIICATNVNLREAVNEGKFREDLYYRLNVISINAPSLRKHKEDIPLLINHFLKQIGDKFGYQNTKLTGNVLDIFMNYDWPGNVRELKHVLERASILSDGKYIKTNVLPEYLQKLSDELDIFQEQNAIKENLKNFEHAEKQLINDALNETNWNRTKAAEKLGITRRTLYNKIKKYNFKRG